MRIRTLMSLVVAALVVVFAMLNWPEISRPTTVNLGFAAMTAPLGTILLGLFVAACLVFAAASASAHTRHLMETRQHAKALQAQRDLADKAEASRFSELRQQLDEHLREIRQRESRSATDMEQTLSRVQRDLHQQMEQLHRALSTRMGEMESRLGQPRGSEPAAAAYSPSAAGAMPASARTYDAETVVSRADVAGTDPLDTHPRNRIS